MSRRRFAWVSAVVCAISAVAGLAAGPAAAPVHPTPYRIPVNPHLHGVTPIAKAKPAEHREGHPAGRHAATTVVTRSRWVHYWNAGAWFALHRGTGVIQGVVRASNGEPLGGISVRLRHPHGQMFRSWGMKHLTRTGPGGVFVMTGVRAGSYRVFAQGGGHKGHALVSLHVGGTAEVNVRA